MKFIKNTNWEEVFEGWRKREANNPGWIRCAIEIKGWPDWESWRRNSASQIEADKRDWQIFQFPDPINEISKMLIGPYSGWQSRLPEKNTATFSDLLKIPEQYDYFSKYEAAVSILDGLPFETEFIGLIRDDINKIVCLEGHHRATVITLAKIQNKNIDFSKTKITIALAHLAKNETSFLNEILKKGSVK